MKQFRNVFKGVVALMVLIIASSLLAGCKQPSDSSSNSDNTKIITGSKGTKITFKNLDKSAGTADISGEYNSVKVTAKVTCNTSATPKTVSFSNITADPSTQLNNIKTLLNNGSPMNLTGNKLTLNGETFDLTPILE
ncbi:MAG: hypothetical protein CR988_06255 [Treponema sp.]|nr:MAG: hypothetical protein CR988_06255 [Treponema sp.]